MWPWPDVLLLGRVPENTVIPGAIAQKLGRTSRGYWRCGEIKEDKANCASSLKCLQLRAHGRRISLSQMPAVYSQLLPRCI